MSAIASPFQGMHHLLALFAAMDWVDWLLTGSLAGLVMGLAFMLWMRLS